jgi:23S rRNA (pseudouridine1915-N3)-methyltransferase
MKITFLFTGKTDGGWIRDGLKEYLDRLRHYADLEVEELAPPKNAGKMQPAQQNRAEGEAQLARINSTDRLILLDAGGKEFDSPGLAAWIEKQQLAGYKRLVFLVGGPYGFSEDVYNRADGKLSLSRLTFSHQMVRVIAAEQLYRAFTILKGEKYHHR